MADNDGVEPKQGKLRELFSQNEAARAILNDFTERQRNQQVTKLDQLLKRLDDQPFSRTAAIQVFRTLQDIGCGHFVEGRKGHPTRFVWEDDLMTAGRAARGEASKIESLNDDDEGHVDPNGARSDVEHAVPLET